MDYFTFIPALSRLDSGFILSLSYFKTGNFILEAAGRVV